MSARRSTSASVKYLGMLLRPPRVGFATHGTAADDAADTMGFLVAHILFVVGFALALRRAQTRGYDFFLMTGTNYATGLVIGAVWLAVAGAASVDLATVLLGIVQGARFSLAVVAIYLLLVRTGVGITFVLLRMAVIVPTVASILWFGERPDLPTLLGIGLMLAALPLLTRGGRSDDSRLRVWWYWPVVVGTLTVTGAGLIAAKAFVEVAPIENMPLYAMTTFAAATTVALATFAVRRRIQPALSPTVDRPAARGFRRGLFREPLALGVVTGGVNMGQLVLILLALREVPGTVVFPAQSAGSALLTIIAGYVLWHERHTRGTLAGAGLAAAGLVLVSV